MRDRVLLRLPAETQRHPYVMDESMAKRGLDDIFREVFCQNIINRAASDGPSLVHGQIKVC
jgi:hypothetical protein